MSAHTDLQKIEEKETLPTEIEKCILYCSNKQKYDVNYIDAILAATELADKNAELSALRARVEALEAEREKSREQIADVNELLWEFSENPNLELGEIGQNKIEDYFKKYSSNAQA